MALGKLLSRNSEAGEAGEASGSTNRPFLNRVAGPLGSCCHGYPSHQPHVVLPFPTHTRNKLNGSQAHKDFDMWLRSSGKLMAPKLAYL